MNETDGVVPPKSSERPPAGPYGGWVAILTATAALMVIGMAGWWLRRESERAESAGGPTAQHAPTDVSANESTDTAAVESPETPTTDMDDRFLGARRAMVEYHFRRRDITDQRVLDVMERVPRHLFVPEHQQGSAYADHPLPIGHGQTISQPYIVALMTQLANPHSGARALDVGTGSGYQAAVLSQLCKEVYSIEIIETLAEQAADRLARLGYDNVRVRAGDGYRGWPEHAPFDVIIVAAAPDHVPEPLVEQLAPGGRMVIPVGRFHQDLMVIEKTTDGTVRQWTEVPVAFVPMTGEAQQPTMDRD